ncbi:MAG: hypothetical protein WBD55_01950, partial [Dehalococcoidia bacterium]
GMGYPASADARQYSVKKPSEQPLSKYAESANQLILVGTTLRSIQPFMDFLRSKAREGTHLTFLLVDEDLFEGDDSLLEQVARRHDRARDDVLAQLRQTTRQLATLQHEFPSNVSVIKLRVLPSFGLTIVDPFTRAAKMRISLYMYQYPAECNLALHIQPSTSESEAIFSRFMAHYNRLVVEAKRARTAGGLQSALDLTSEMEPAAVS